MSKDFSQANDLAAKEPKKLRELQELFWIEAAKYNVLPLDNSKIERMDVNNRPSLTRGRAVFVYYPGLTAALRLRQGHSAVCGRPTTARPVPSSKLPSSIHPAVKPGATDFGV